MIEDKLNKLISRRGNHGSKYVYSIVFNCLDGSLNGDSEFCFSYNIEFLSIAEDVIILKLENMDQDLKPLKLSTDVHGALKLNTNEHKTFDIFGFPEENGIKVDEHCGVVTDIDNFSKESKRYFKERKFNFVDRDFNLKAKPSKLYFHCSVDMSYGASGSPGIVYEIYGNFIYPEVVCMLKKGHPKSYYDKNYALNLMKSDEHGQHLSYLIEEGLSMDGLSALLRDRGKQELHQKLFGTLVEDPQSKYLCKGRSNSMAYSIYCLSIYIPRKQSLGGYRNHPVCLSVCLSVRPSVRLSVQSELNFGFNF